MTLFFVLLVVRPSFAADDDPSSLSELKNLSIDQLADVEIYSVAKSKQTLSDSYSAYAGGLRIDSDKTFLGTNADDGAIVGDEVECSYDVEAKWRI